MSTCLTPTLQVTNVNRADTNDFTTLLTMRYRLESDPDIDASYTAVTTTQVITGITFPYFDITTIDPGTYVLHTYLTSDGSSTGTKVTVVIGCDDALP